MAMMNGKQLQLLGATYGAYSVVTEREATGDRSVTLDMDEKNVLAQKMDLGSIARRSGVMDHRPDRQWFSILNPYNIFDSSMIHIPIVYPKSTGNEIRLYMQGSIDFFGNTGDVFVIFCRDSEQFPRIGFIRSADWDKFWGDLNYVSEVNSTIYIQDVDDNLYQQSLLATQAGIPIQQNYTAYPRNSGLAKKAIEMSGFTCEFDPRHHTFRSPVTGRNFMEAHHLIPMSHQASFPYCPLDQLGNIVSLCPCCHKAIHLGDSSVRKELLWTLFNKKGHALQQMGVNFETLCSLYGISS
jgi:5-methylcytosine-specific restriction protein A